MPQGSYSKSIVPPATCRHVLITTHTAEGEQRAFAEDRLQPEVSGWRGVLLRGDGDDSDANFIQLPVLRLHNMDDQHLTEWLERKANDLSRMKFKTSV